MNKLVFCSTEVIWEETYYEGQTINLDDIIPAQECSGVVYLEIELLEGDEIEYDIGYAYNDPFPKYYKTWELALCNDSGYCFDRIQVDGFKIQTSYYLPRKLELFQQAVFDLGLQMAVCSQIDEHLEAVGNIVEINESTLQGGLFKIQCPDEFYLGTISDLLGNPISTLTFPKCQNIMQLPTPPTEGELGSGCGITEQYTYGAWNQNINQVECYEIVGPTPE